MFRNNLTVLLADDESAALRLMEERINKMENVQVVASVTNGISAKKYLLEHQVDLVITDIRMPFMDGLELAQFIRQFDPGCQTVIISGFGEFEYARQAVQHGVREYLLKPVRSGQLNEAIGKVSLAVQQKRSSLMTQLIGNHEDLESRLIAGLHRGASAETWRSPLSELMCGGGAVVMLEQKGECSLEKETRSKIYRNLLADGLPGQTVLRLGYQHDKFWFLIIPTKAEYHRQIRNIPEYLERVLTAPVEWTLVEEVESPRELELLFGAMGNCDRRSTISAACDYMREHLKEPLTRETVAEKVYLTPCYFSSLFKKETGKGFNEYLTELRMDQAKKLLTRNLSIREVGETVGFRDPRYFSDVFSKKTGYLPSQYRNALLKGEISAEES